MLKSRLSSILCSASDPFKEYSICLSRHCPEAETYFEGQTQKIVHILCFCEVKQSSFRSLVMDFFHVYYVCSKKWVLIKSSVIFVHAEHHPCFCLIQCTVSTTSKAKRDESRGLTKRSGFHLLNFHHFWVHPFSYSQRIKSAITSWPQSNQTQPSSVFSWLFWPCQVLLQSGSLSSRVEVDMIAFKQPLLASDTQLQPGTSSDSKSTMMDCLAKTADQRRSKFRCVSGCTRHVQSPEMAFPQTSERKAEFLFRW